MFRINFGIGLDLLVKYPLCSAWQSVALMVAAAAGGQNQPRVTGRLAKSRRRAQSFQVESSSSKFIANLNFRSHTAATVLRSTSFGAGANPGHSDPAPAAIPGPELGYILMNYNTNDRNRIGVVIVIRCC